MILPYKLLHPAAKPPKFSHETDACFDLTAAVRYDTDGNSRVYDTGLAFQIPKGYYVELAIRSGLAFSGGFILANGVGIIDSGYIASVKCKLVYLGEGNPDWPRVGDRIAQGRLVRLTKTELQEVQELDETERGENGLGSTGR
jgi:dUTP pyrophosphatase